MGTIDFDKNAENIRVTTKKFGKSINIIVAFFYGT